jgi:uncharacterized membrane-anchored protein
MKKTYIYLLFGLMVIAQIFASAQVVYKFESIITSDNVYKFKTAPIDPSDPFRGKYITLNYEINSFEAPENDWEDYQDGYAYFSKDENGYAVLETLTKEPLASSEFDYIVVETYNYNSNTIRFDLPFDRYYMEESKAYDAEVFTRELRRDGKDNDVYAEVHIKGDTHVLTDIIANDISVIDAVKK